MPTVPGLNAAKVRQFLPVTIALLAALSLTACRSAPPTALGVHHGSLSPCPSSPNCVSSTAPDAAHRIAPIALSGDAPQAWNRLRERVAALPRTTIVANHDGYLHALCRSRVFGFIDDLELLLNRSAGVIEVRSAARLGYYDFGVNRARVATLRAAFRDNNRRGS